MNKIAIGIPAATNYYHRKFVESLMGLKYPKDSQIKFIILSGHQLPFARNRIVEIAIEWGATHLFWIDADMVFPPNSLIHLFNRKLDIIHALSFRRIRPFYPCAFKWNSKENNFETIDYSEIETDLFEADAAGSACTLINIEVYKKLKKPYYYYKDNLYSSDLTFSINVKKLGYKIWVDRTLTTGHIGEEIVITEDLYLNTLSEDSKNLWNSNIRKAIANEKENYDKKK